MNKKWAEDYSSEEGSNDEAEGSDDGARTLPEVEGVTSSNIVNTQKFIVQVSDISFSASRNQIGKFFEDAGCKILRIDLLESNGRSKGIAVIEFANVSSLDICMGLKNSFVFGRNIKISLFDEHSKNELNKAHSKISHQQSYHDTFASKRNEKNKAFEKVKHLDFQRKPIATDDRAVYSGTSSMSKLSDAVSERPKLNLKPRTLPVENTSTFFKQTIFGGGRAHDEVAYEV